MQFVCNCVAHKFSDLDRLVCLPTVGDDEVAGVVLLSSEDCLNMVFFRIGVDAIDRAVDSVLFLTGDDIFRWESFRKKEFLLCPSSELRLEESKILGTFLDRNAMLVSIPVRCFVFALVLDSFSIVFYVYTNSVFLVNSNEVMFYIYEERLLSSRMTVTDGFNGK